MSTPQPLHFNAVSFSLFMTLLPTSEKKARLHLHTYPHSNQPHKSCICTESPPQIYTQVWVCGAFGHTCMHNRNGLPGVLGRKCERWVSLHAPENRVRNQTTAECEQAGTRSCHFWWAEYKDIIYKYRIGSKRLLFSIFLVKGLVLANAFCACV